MTRLTRHLLAAICISAWIAGPLWTATAAEPRVAIAPEPSATNNLILVCWDGAGHDIVQKLLADGRLPNLAALIKAGSFRRITIDGHLTETLPGHAEMLTGLGPDKTGVKSNFDRGPVPAGLSLFERLENGLGTNAIATIMITGKSKVAALYNKAETLMDTVDAGDRFSTDVGTTAVAALNRHGKRRFFAFVHFLDPDAAGHGSGSDSPQYAAAVEACDRWLGMIMDMLAPQGLDKRTFIYVTADHGFDAHARVHHDAPDIWLATNDKAVIRNGNMADVPATILFRFGLDLSTLKPALSGAPLTAPAPGGGPGNHDPK